MTLREGLRLRDPSSRRAVQFTGHKHVEPAMKASVFIGRASTASSHALMVNLTSCATVRAPYGARGTSSSSTSARDRTRAVSFRVSMRSPSNSDGGLSSARCRVFDHPATSFGSRRRRRDTDAASSRNIVTSAVEMHRGQRRCWCSGLTNWTASCVSARLTRTGLLIVSASLAGRCGSV